MSMRSKRFEVLEQVLEGKSAIFGWLSFQILTGVFKRLRKALNYGVWCKRQEVLLQMLGLKTDGDLREMLVAG